MGFVNLTKNVKEFRQNFICITAIVDGLPLCVPYRSLESNLVYFL